MSIERTQPQFGFRQGVPSGLLAQGAHKVPAEAPSSSDIIPPGFAFGAFSAGSHALRGQQWGQETMGQLWSDRAMLWSTREGLTSAASRFFGRLPVSPSSIVSGTRFSGAGLSADVADTLSSSSAMPKALPSVRTYGQLFRLGGARNLPDMPSASRQVSPLKDGSAYRGQVAENFREFRNSVGRRGFFDGVTPKSFLKETVWEGNMHSIRQIRTAQTWGERLPGISRLGGLGLLAFDVLKSTRETYQIAKEQEDGSLSSRLKTWGRTAKTFGQKAGKNLLAWEIAGAAAAFGHALALPGLAGILAPVGIGAAAAAGAICLMNKVVKEPQRPPEPENPFASAQT